MFARIITMVVFIAVVTGAVPARADWEVADGAEYVRTFPVDFIPEAVFYPALAVKGRPDEIMIFPGRLDQPLEIAGKWQPAGKPLDTYVFVLHLSSGEVTLLPIAGFIETETLREDFRIRFCSDFRELRFTGKETGNAHINRRNGREYIAAMSGNVIIKKKRTFGIPSPIPFMGRQKFIETEETESGTAFIEVFDRKRSPHPIVRFRNEFRNLDVAPIYTTNPAWVQGAEKPLLVLVGKEEIEGGGPGNIFVVSLPELN